MASSGAAPSPSRGHHRKGVTDTPAKVRQDAPQSLHTLLPPNSKSWGGSCPPGVKRPQWETLGWLQTLRPAQGGAWGAPRPPAARLPCH